ncbi:methyltransferase domain-containing protein, partial [Mycetohabitans sp. B8]|nr:methyltransferase domain-containing protein [Mycetohabitans sp. B8]
MTTELDSFIQQVRGEKLSEADALDVIRDLHHAMRASDAPGGVSDTSSTDILGELAGFLCETIGCVADEVDPHRALADYGFNSISLTDFSKRIATRYAVTLGPAAFLEHPSLAALADHVVAKLSSGSQRSAELAAARARRHPRGEQASASPRETAPRHGADHAREPRWHACVAEQNPKQRPIANRVDDIAIIGMGACLPKSDSLQDFWRRLVADESFISEVPTERWDWRAHFDDPALANKTDCRHGAFINDVRGFDALHFNIAPNEAALIDPQHRLALQVVWETLESAGYARESLRQCKVGVFFGIERRDYADLIRACGIDIDGHLNTGNAPGMLVNRIAHFFDWRGPVSAVDAACASSFVALNEAVIALRYGCADAAVVGGVNLLLTPDVNIYNRKLGLFTGAGKVRPFDKHADGHVFSDGVGAVFLKRLDDAERDNDTILGVIKGLSVRHGGKSLYLTAPNAEIHRVTIAEALEQARLTPEDIDYIEAQGTANPMADDVELRVLHEVFCDRKAGKPKLGTLKGQLGHCSGASGVISLLKAMLSLHTDTLVKIANLRELNWADDEGEFACEPVTETATWPSTTRDGKRLPRHVGIHNFGFGGVTGHLVLAEYVDQRQAERGARRFDEQAIVLSARTAPQLEQLARRLLDFLTAEQCSDAPTHTLDDIAYTLQTGRDHWNEYRMVVFADSLATLVVNLSRCLDGNDDERAFVQRDVQAGRDVRQLFSSPDMQSTVHHWLDKRNMRGLGRIWASGVAVDWASLYAGGRLPKKVTLPTYPFTRQSLWIPSQANSSRTVASAPRSMLDRNVSTFASQQYVSTFDGSEDWFRLSPDSTARAFIELAHLDMIDEAVRQAADVAASESVYLHVRDIVHPQPLAVTDKPVQVRTIVAPAGDGGIGYRLVSDGGDGERVYATGNAELLMLEHTPVLDVNTLASVDGVLECADVLVASAVSCDDGTRRDVIAVAVMVASWVASAKGCVPLPAVIRSIGDANFYGRARSDSRIWARLAPRADDKSGVGCVDVDVFDSSGRVFIQLREVICAWSSELSGARSEAHALPAQSNGMIPTLNGTGAMTTRLLACSEAFVEFAATAAGDVMDMGCAYGVATLAALERGARVWAVDIDERHLSILSEQVGPALKARLVTHCGALPSMDIAEGQFAAIHAARVLHFLDPDAFRESLCKMARWLAPGGKLFVTCDSPYFPHWSARVAEYEQLAAGGHAWPGYIADLAAYFRQRVGAGAGGAMDT